MDYTFNMTTASLDLSTARDKSLAADRLLPIIADLKNYTSIDHYLEKLGELTGTSKYKLEGALSKIRSGTNKFQGKKPEKQATNQVSRPVYSSPLEEYCLALLLQHPELKECSQEPLPEYFENSENREIFTAWQQSGDILSLKGGLDTAIQEHLNSLMNKDLIDNRIEQKYVDCVLRLRERFLRSLEVKRAAALALEAELGGSAAELAKLKEQGTEVSTQLGEVFTQKSRGTGIKGGKK